MRAIGMQRSGGALILMDVPRPGIDDDEVLVRVKAIGVGSHDRWFMPENAVFPYPIGIEAAGVVEETGGAVTGFQPGDEVMFTSSMQPKGGVWAEYASVAERALLRIPAGLGFIKAAALPVAGTTAAESLALLDLDPDDTVFMAGASGAIGTITIQLAKRLGCRVAASASSRNHDYMRSLGVDKSVDYHDSDWTDQIRTWIPGGVDAALAIQPGTGADCLRVVRDGGKVVTVSGDQVSAERGVVVAQVKLDRDTRPALAQLASDVASGLVHIEIEKVYPFEQGVEALEKTETRHARGKLVLDLEYV